MTGGVVAAAVPASATAESGLLPVISAPLAASGVLAALGVPDAVFVLSSAADSPVAFAAAGSVEATGSFALLEFSGDIAALEVAATATCSEESGRPRCASEALFSASVEVSLEALGKFLDVDEVDDSDIAAVTAITSPAQKSCTRIPTLTGVKNGRPSGGRLSSCESGLVIKKTISLRIALV